MELEVTGHFPEGACSDCCLQKASLGRVGRLHHVTNEIIKVWKPVRQEMLPA